MSKITLTFEEILKSTSINMWLLGLPIELGCPVMFRFIFNFINLQIILIEEALFIISRMEPEHFLEVTTLLPCVSLGILSQYKAFALFLNRKKISKILDSFKILHQNMTVEEFRLKEVGKYFKIVKFTTKYVFWLNQIMLWVYNLIPLFLMGYDYWKNGQTTAILPFMVLLPFDYDTWKGYLVAYIHIITAAMTTVVSLVSADALYFVLTTHIYVNFVIVCHQLNSLTPDNANSLVDIVKRHQYLIELSQEMEEIFSPSLLLNFLVSSVEICMNTFNIVAGDLVHLPSFLIFLTSSLVRIFLLSFFGDLLINESLRVGDAAYKCQWYNMDRKTKMDLVIIRERAQRAQAMTGMKFIPMSYPTFSKIISTSWSYFTIIQSVYSPPEEQ